MKFIANLGATYEEKVFAEMELRRIGDFAIPYMVNELRITRDREVYAGILDAIKQLEPGTIAGWVAALDGLSPDHQFGVVRAIAQRPDVLALQDYAQSDLAPFLWRVVAQPKDQSPTLRALSVDLLNKIRPGTKAESRNAEAELVALARTFYDRTARFSGVKTNPDGTSTVPVWVMDNTDSTTPKLVKLDDVPLGRAEEYYGLRYARWALDRKPDYEPAQGLILALAAERAIERAKFGNLTRTEPATFRLLSDAPSPVLNDLLNRGLNQKKTALVLAMVQVLGDRADRDAATPPPGTPPRPSLFVRALSYPDPQVQFEAANALLRSPVPVPPSVRGQIVDVLRRAAGADSGAPSGATGTALLADPNKTRSDAVAFLLRALGFNVEVFTTGRDLQRRIARASDFDVILIDRHTANPELLDLVGQLAADTKAANRPTFVIASADKPRVPTFDQLLVRFACLVAATENEVVLMPPVYVPDPRDTPEDVAIKRRANQERRDGVFRSTAASRIARLQRVVHSTGLDLSPAQKLLFDLRVQLITLTILGAEYPISPESAPETADAIAKIRKQLALQPPSPTYGAGTPTTDLLKLIERFEIDLARVPTAQKRFEDLYAKIDPVELGLPVETFRDPALEARLARLLQNYPAVRIIPEPYGRSEMAADLNAVFAATGQPPRDATEKRAAQRIAIHWLRDMATGDLPGYEVKSAEPELRAALRVDAVAEDAIDAVARFGSSEAQQDLLSVALTAGRPLPIRSKAADATIRHIQVNGKLIPKSLIDPLLEAADQETDPGLRGKFLTLRGMLAYNAGDYLKLLKGYNPPLLPPAPPKDVKDTKDSKEPPKTPPPGP
jgi:CheY-like chemotaxis protein